MRRPSIPTTTTVALVLLVLAAAGARCTSGSQVDAPNQRVKQSVAAVERLLERFPQRARQARSR